MNSMASDKYVDRRDFALHFIYLFIWNEWKRASGLQKKEEKKKKKKEKKKNKKRGLVHTVCDETIFARLTGK